MANNSDTSSDERAQRIAELKKKMQDAAKKAKETYEREVKRAKEKYVKNLKTAMKTVMRKGDLEEATKIKKVIEENTTKKKLDVKDIIGEYHVKNEIPISKMVISKDLTYTNSSHSGKVKLTTNGFELHPDKKGESVKVFNRTEDDTYARKDNVVIWKKIK